MWINVAFAFTATPLADKRWHLDLPGNRILKFYSCQKLQCAVHCSHSLPSLGVSVRVHSLCLLKKMWSFHSKSMNFEHFSSATKRGESYLWELNALSNAVEALLSCAVGVQSTLQEGVVQQIHSHNERILGGYFITPGLPKSPLEWHVCSVHLLPAEFLWVQKFGKMFSSFSHLKIQNKTKLSFWS